MKIVSTFLKKEIRKKVSKTEKKTRMRGRFY